MIKILLGIIIFLIWVISVAISYCIGEDDGKNIKEYEFNMLCKKLKDTEEK